MSETGRRPETAPLSARAAALAVLTRVRMKAAWPDAALRAAARDVPARDFPLCARLVYTVLQNRLLLDAWIARHSSLRLNKLEPAVLDALRLGICQLKLMDGIPARAAIFETVELVKSKAGGRATGLCNAVLRAVERDTTDIAPETCDVQSLSLRLSHPAWLVEKLSARYGAAETERLLLLNNTPPPLTVHVNPLRTSPEEVLAAFASLGAEAEPAAGVSGCLRVSYQGDLTRTALWTNGCILLADPAARIVVDRLAPRPGERILDCCAAPGGKAFLSAFAAQGKCRITALDVHEHKIRRLREESRRLGLENCVTAEVEDARSFQNEAGFDAVLADTPCSGTGVIRKRPDIRYKDPETLLQLPALQQSILAGAARSVRPGGRLMYATCSLLPDENEHVTTAFLAENPCFSLSEQQILWPPESGTDGFYYALMEKSHE